MPEQFIQQSYANFFEKKDFFGTSYIILVIEVTHYSYLFSCESQLCFSGPEQFFGGAPIISVSASYRITTLLMFKRSTIVWLFHLILLKTITFLFVICSHQFFVAPNKFFQGTHYSFFSRLWFRFLLIFFLYYSFKAKVPLTRLSDTTFWPRHDYRVRSKERLLDTRSCRHAVLYWGRYLILQLSETGQK